MGSNATVNFINNSGLDLVIAFVQGAEGGQSAADVAWLKYATGTSSWDVPTPTTEKDLLPYMTELKTGSSATVSVPQYTQDVGFRCLVAEPAYKSDALQYLGGTAYMAFPDLNTATYIFDKFEAGLTEGFPGIWNITAVDFVALPMQLSCNGTKVGFKDGVSSVGLQQKLSALGTPYSTGASQAPNTPDKTYRFFAPGHLNDTQGALDIQITWGLVMLHYNSTTVDYGNYTFNNFTTQVSLNNDGTVTGSVTCDYTCLGSSPVSITVNDVTTPNAFAGEIVGATNPIPADAAAQVELGAILSAAICRGVAGFPNQWGDIVHNNSNCPTPWNYYADGAMQYDKYSQLIHSYSIDGKNYGFPYDDYFGDEAGFTAVAGDTIDVTILPYGFTAEPNGPVQKNTGCVVATIPPGADYPSGSGWSIGKVIVGGNTLQSGSNILCLLNSDTVVCTFPAFPGRQMHIDMTKTSGGNSALSFFENGQPQPGQGITGLVYEAASRTLSFGTTAAWVIT